MNERSDLGQIGEEAAAVFLRRKGYEILDRNFQNSSGKRLGEIDIIAKDNTKDEIVFVEVKTREYKKYGHTLPEENITWNKLRRLSRIANFYLLTKRLVDQNYRFDAISVWVNMGERKAKIKHITGL